MDPLTPRSIPIAIRAAAVVWALTLIWISLIAHSFLGIGPEGERSWVVAWYAIDGWFDVALLGVGGSWVWWSGRGDSYLAGLAAVALGLALWIGFSPAAVGAFPPWPSSEHPSSAVVRIFLFAGLIPYLVTGRDLRRVFIGTITALVIFAAAQAVLANSSSFLGLPLFPPCGMGGDPFCIVSHKNQFGSLVYLLPGILCAWGLSGGGVQKWIGLALGGGVAIQVAFSHSQGTQIAFLVSLLPLVAWGMGRRFSWALVGVVLVALLYTFLFPFQAWERIGSIGFATRMPIWGDAMMELAAVDGGWWRGRSEWFHPKGTHSHSVLLHYWLHFGLVGLIGYGVLLAMGMALCLRQFPQRFSALSSQVLFFALLGGHLISLVTVFTVSARSAQFLLFWSLMGWLVFQARTKTFVAWHSPRFAWPALPKWLGFARQFPGPPSMNAS